MENQVYRILEILQAFSDDRFNGRLEVVAVTGEIDAGRQYLHILHHGRDRDAPIGEEVVQTLRQI